MEFGTYPTGWHIKGDLPNQVAVSTGSTVVQLIAHYVQLMVLVKQHVQLIVLSVASWIN